MLNHPYGLAVDKKGDLFIADNGNHAIREVTPDGNIETFAGNQTFNFGYSGDGGPANFSQLTYPTDVAVDSSGNVYIADYGNFVIRQVTTDGTIHTYAGNNTIGFSGDGGAPTSAALYQPFGVAVDSSGNVYIAEYGDSRIRKVTTGTGAKISTIAGNGTYGFAGDGAAATSAELNFPHGLCVDSSGNIFIADFGNNRIRKIVSGGNISTFAGNGLTSYSGDSGGATQAQFNTPSGVAIDAAGNIYVADTINNAVRQITTKGVISTFAGTGTAGFSGDGSAANKGQLNAPQGVAVDAAGNVYIADSGNLRVRVVGTNGNISTFAGSGSPGYGGDGGAATSATFYLPSAVATDKSGNVYIADYQVSVVRKVVSGGTISTVAGNGMTGYSGDGGMAVAAQLNGPSAVAVDSTGNLYITQLIDSRARMVSAQGVITTIAGTGANGYSGEGLPALSSQLASPGGVVADGKGNV
jgi:sugar lactone lactonase YvrE